MSNPNPSPETRFKPGESGNPSGRPKNTMKDYLRRKFLDMTDEEKELFAKQISAEMQVKLAEGNPANNTDITSGGKPLILPAELINKNDTPQDPETGSEGHTQV